MAEQQTLNLHEDFKRRSKLEDLGRWYVTRFVMESAQSLPQSSRVLDAGAGECVYKPYFAHCEYEAIDLAVGENRWNYTNLDYVAPLDKMPIEDGRFDAVVCTQVLEHLDKPKESLAEMYRVLKPGGRLFLTAPMSHPEHQIPYDFFRYTSYGLRSLLEAAGFRNSEVRAFGGIFTRWAYEAPRLMEVFPGTGIGVGKPSAKGIAVLPLRLASKIMIKAVQGAFLFLERYDQKKDDPFGWQVIATK